MTSILHKMPVIVSQKDAYTKYGVSNGQFISFRGYFLLKRKTIDRMTATVEKRTNVIGAIVVELKKVMGLDAEGKANGPVAERFCMMNGLDIKKADFFMESTVISVEKEAFVFFARQDDKTKDIVFLWTDLGKTGVGNKLLFLGEDNEGRAFWTRYGNHGLKDTIENITELISSKLKVGFVAVHSLYIHDQNADHHVKKTLYP